MSRKSIDTASVLDSSTYAGNRYMNAAKYGLDRVYFGGCFIRGETDDIFDNVLD